MSQPSALADFQPGEIALSLMVALGVLGGAAFALSASALEMKADAPQIDKGMSVPVKIVPMLDPEAPLLKLGGKRDRMKLPDRWVRQTPKPRVEQQTFVSPKASKSVEDIPDKHVKMADAGAKPPPPDAGLVKQADTPPVEVVDAGPPANVDEKGHSDGVKGGTELDPLKARAVSLYRMKIAGFFSSRFRVSGSGLSKEDLVKYRVVATVSVGGDRSVTGFNITPSGNAAFDAAARATLQGTKGVPLPPPPENYPDVVQSTITITLVCRPDKCD